MVDHCQARQTTKFLSVIKVKKSKNKSTNLGYHAANPRCCN